MDKAKTIDKNLDRGEEESAGVIGTPVAAEEVETYEDLQHADHRLEREESFGRPKDGEGGKRSSVQQHLGASALNESMPYSGYFARHPDTY